MGQRPPDRHQPERADLTAPEYRSGAVCPPVADTASKGGTSMAGGRSGRIRLARWCAAVLCTFAAAVAMAAPLDDWRASVTQTRLLADNDGPAAYEQALQLLASLPADATPVDRASALNLLARTEIHLALTKQATEHAEQALQIAGAAGDRAGQAEAEINL
jgi:hypothetical protein